MGTSRISHVVRVGASYVVLVTTLAVVGSSPAAFGAPSNAPNIDRLETLVFRASLDTFMSASRHRSGEDASYDWTTDHCSAPLVGSTGRSFDFTSPCTRHDFAYRNFKRVDAGSARRGQFWNSTVRHRIDLRFQQDMRSHCSRRPTVERGSCLVWAELFYRLVRVAGGP